MCKGPFIKFAEQSLDYIISSLFLALEIYQEGKLKFMQIVGLSTLFIALLSKVCYEKKCKPLKADLSPYLLWLLTIERIYTVNQTQSQTNVLLFYILGFSNGQYTSTIRNGNKNKGFLIGKLSIQGGMFLTLLLISNNLDILTLILLSIILLAVSLEELRQFTPKDISIQPSLNQSSFQIHISPLNNHSLSRSRLHENEISFIQIDQQQIELQPPQQSINWKKYIEQSDDYICRLTLNQQLDKTLEQAQKNYSFCKFLQDTKLNILQFMKEVKVKNELNVSLYDLGSSEIKQINLYDWINSNLESNMMGIFKQIKPNQQLLLDGNLAVSLAEAQNSAVIDPFLEMSMSGISAIPLIQGSLDVSNMKNRLGLYGKLRVNNLYLRKQNQLIIKEVDGETNKIIVLLFRDLEHQVRQIKLNQKNVEKVNSTIKFIQQQAAMIQQVHIKILRQQNLIGESQRSRQTTQNRAISMSSQKDFIDDALSEITEKSQKSLHFYHSFICKLQYSFLKIQQNNFNYFEVYSVNDIIQFDKKRVDISQLIHLLFEQFHYDELVCQLKIKLTLDDSNLMNRSICTDTRRLKQLIFNLISNAISSYKLDHDPYQMKFVEIILQGYEDTIQIEVIDNGCGILEEQITSKRLQECKLGLAASQKLLYQIGSGDKQFRIRSQKGRTVIKFELPTVLEIERLEAFEEEFDFDSIQFTSS